MAALASRAPTLHKPKSKLRLRLGLDSDTMTPDQHLQSGHDHDASTTFSSPASQDADNPLAQSTNTGSSTLSRGDAFALDLSPSTASDHYSPNPAFDTISYASASPQSATYNIDHSTSSAPYDHSGADAYPTPSPSASPPPQHLEPEPPQQSTAQDREVHLAVSHPNIAAAASGADDIFYVTDEQLSRRLMFVEEIGYGNWGSVWQCVPRKFKPSGQNDMVGARLGWKSAVSGGSGAGGAVAAKLVHRQKSAVSS